MTEKPRKKTATTSKPKTKGKTPPKGNAKPRAKSKAVNEAQDPSFELHPDKKRIAQYLAVHGYEPGGKRRNGAFVGACRKYGLSRNQLSIWVKEPGFMEYVESQKVELMDEAILCLRAALRDKNVTSAIYLLKTLKPEVYDEAYRSNEQRHRHAVALAKVKADLVGDVTSEPITYKVIVTEEPMPGDPAEAERKEEE